MEGRGKSVSDYLNNCVVLGCNLWISESMVIEYLRQFSTSYMWL